MYGALVESPSCISSFSGRQLVRELLRRNRPVVAWCEHVVTLGCFPTYLANIHTFTYTTCRLSVDTGLILLARKLERLSNPRGKICEKQ